MRPVFFDHSRSDHQVDRQPWERLNEFSITSRERSVTGHLGVAPPDTTSTERR